MKKILIVDDLEYIRELVEVTLRAEDYEIYQANSGMEALRIVEEKKPDLVIMDVMMPGEIDGIEALKIIRKNPELKNSKIILLTGKGQEYDRQLGYDAGADDYFIKPFSPLELIKKVGQILGND
ncbi:response regulator [bacterium]|nr:response regulator [bacterium]